MGTSKSAAARTWALAERQHGLVTRRQLLALGYTEKGVVHRVAKGRLFSVTRGVYAVGWPQMTARRRWMAAVLACGEGAALGHRSAAALWGIAGDAGRRVDITVRRRCEIRRPSIRAMVSGFEVDFHWPELGLVIETDGLRYHRTPSEQARDRLRDQTHTAAGLTCLRFTHRQVKYESAHVRDILARTAARLRP